MGARIAKVITDVEGNSELENAMDVEKGESTWDSDTSSVEDVDAGSSSCESTVYKYDPTNEPYAVERRFVAGTNSFEYNVIKRK